jgi:membrane-bound lytic murein transglycosylase B
MSNKIDSIHKWTPPVQRYTPTNQREVLITAYNSRQKVRVFPIKWVAGIAVAVVAAGFGIFPYVSANVQELAASKEKPKEIVVLAKTPEESVPEELLKLDMGTIQPINIAEEKAKEQNARIMQRILSQKDKPGTFQDIYIAAQKKYGVPWQILAAVHYVETGQSGNTDRGSSAGAVGPMQFLPSTFAAYAQDGNGDGVTSIYDVHDAIFSAAKLLAANGADSGNVGAALYRYNHSLVYVYRVLGIAKGFGYNG